MQLEDIRGLVAADLAATDQLILTKLSSDVPLAKEIANHIISSGGKRMRPLLGLLTAKALDYKGDDHIKLAATVELLHTATLLHDDVIDSSTMRRGRPTANNQWGNEASVLVGDLLYARAFQLIAELKQPEITQLLADASSIIVEGEVLQLAHCHDPNTDENTYLEIIKRKTGSLFKVSAACAPQLTNSSQAIFDGLSSYGENLGIAFQMLDDALDYDADPEQTGKNLGDDLAEGKPTLPLIYILKNGNEQQANLVRQAINQHHDDNVATIQQLIHETGAIEYTKKLAKHYVQQSIENLNVLPESAAKNALIGLAKLAGDRKN